MLNKVQKHFKILQRRLNNKSQIKKISSLGNETLDAIVKSISMVVNNDFTNEDEQKFRRQREYGDRLSNDTSMISYAIFGNNNEKTVSEVYSKAASPQVWCKLFYSLIKNLRIKYCLEIGTNLGVSGGYILEAMDYGEEYKFITLEGVPKMCEISSNHFSEIVENSNFEVIQGLYENTFQKVIDNDYNYDLIFIDGNHQKDPTIHYFNELKSKLADKAVIIFDDINWSNGMKEAWQIISEDPIVNYSIDFYKLGIVVIEKNNSDKNKSFELHLAY